MEVENWASILVGAGSWTVSCSSDGGAAFAITAAAVSRHFRDVLKKPERLGAILVEKYGSEEEALYRCCRKADCVPASCTVVRWLLKRISLKVQACKCKKRAFDLICRISGNTTLAKVILDEECFRETGETGKEDGKLDRQALLDGGLLQAAEHGLDGVVAFLLEEGAHADSVNSRALMNAIMYHHESTAKMLLSPAPSNNRPARADGAGMLFAAISNNNVQGAKLLLSQELHPAIPAASPVCLTMAVMMGDPEMVLSLLAAPVGPADPDDGSAFSQAVYCGFTSIVGMLLQHGVRESMLVHVKDMMSNIFMSSMDVSDEMYACLESFLLTPVLVL